MWGNKEGWLISAVIAVLMGYMIFSFGRLPPPSPPTGQFSYLTSPIELPVKPESVRPIFTEKRDAGDQYWQATQEYVGNKKAYDNFFAPRQQSFSRLDNLPSVEPAMKLLIAAAPATEAKVFIRQPELLVNYRYPYPELEGLNRLGRIANQIGMSYAAKGNFEQAQRYYDAAFSLGQKMFEERINSSQLFLAQGLMREAAVLMARAADKQGDAAAKAKYEQFDSQTRSWYENRFDKLIKVVTSIGASEIRNHAGDVIALATESPERVWRVEALLKLGRYKYNAGPADDRQAYANQKWITRYLNEPARYGKSDPAEDKDAAVRLAAKLARELTPEGYNQIDFLD